MRKNLIKMEKIIIDAEGANFGRLCSYAAKQALGGNEIIIINSEKTIITGSKKDIIGKYNAKRNKGGHSRKGPRYSKFTFKMLKWGIKGMLPDHRWGTGKDALSRIKCYDGIPKEFEGKKMIKLKKKDYSRFIVLKELSEKI